MARIVLVIAAAVVVSVAAWSFLRERDAAMRPPERGEPRAGRMVSQTAGPSRSVGTAIPGEVGRPASRAASRPAWREAADAAPDDCLIRGRVVDRSGIPINHASVRVELFSPAREPNYAVVDEFETTIPVDAEARFAAVVPRNGRYEVSARAPGFAPAKIERIKPGSDVEIGLDVPGRVSGRVFDAATGKPVPGAPLRLSAWESGVDFERGPSVTSGADGAYVFEDVPSGYVTVYVLLEGYLSSSAVAPMTFEVGEAKTRDFRLERGLSISGRVLDRETGRPIQGAKFDGWEVATDAKGAFMLGGFESGEFVLKPCARGWVAGWLNVRVSARRPLEGLEIRLTRAATLKGIVVDQAGGPVAGATVEDGSERATTAADGSFEIAVAIAAGSTADSCSLWISRPGQAPVSVDVDFSNPQDPVVIRLEPQDAVVSGTVLSTERKPVGGARVEVRGNAFRRLAESDAQGGFAFAKLPRFKSVQITVVARGFDAQQVELEREGGATGMEIVLATEGTREPERPAAVAVAAQPVPRGRAKGRVVDGATGQPLPSSAVACLHTAEEGGYRVDSGVSQEGSGEFDFDASVGELWLDVSADGYVPSPRRSVVITQGAVSEVGTVALSRAGGIEGTIVRAGGEAGGRLGVVVSRAGGRFEWAGWTDDTGWYEIDGLARGEWLVYGADSAWDSGLVQLSLIGRAVVDAGGVVRVDGRMAAPASVVVEATTGPGAATVEDPPSLTSECDPNRFDFDQLPGALAVCIRSKAGLPVVWVNNTVSSPWFAAVWRIEGGKVEFPVSHLAAGEYVVKVQRAGVAVERTVRLEAGEQKRVVVDLSK
jgi:protocatechuate 3,4-dioxygenase beta subunit